MRLNHKTSTNLNPVPALCPATALFRKREKNVQTGKITYFNAEKGYGFIRSDALGADQFFHISGIIGGARELSPGQRVSFDVEFDPRKMKDKAVSVQTI